jgi:hypothetical protein
VRERVVRLTDGEKVAVLVIVPYELLSQDGKFYWFDEQGVLVSRHDTLDDAMEAVVPAGGVEDAAR